MYACKTLRLAGSEGTTHLTDANTNEVMHCVTKIHDWIMKAWVPLFRMYKFQPEAAWEVFRLNTKTNAEDGLRSVLNKYMKMT